MKAGWSPSFKRRCSNVIAVSHKEVNMSRPVLSFLLVTVLVLVLAACGQPAPSTPAPAATEAPPPTEVPTEAPTSQPSHRLLFIGSSLISGMGKCMQEVVSASDVAPVDMETETSWANFATLEQHWNGNTLARDAGDAIGTDTLTRLDEGQWDTVLVQENIAGSLHREAVFHEYVRKFDERIKAVGARPVLFMHWERKQHSRLAMDEIARFWTDLGAELDSPVAPVGLAWQWSLQERPDLELYADTIHPTEAGRYLAICVLYATVFDETPVGLSVEPWEFGVLLSKEDAAFLQRIAAETVEEYQAGL